MEPSASGVSDGAAADGIRTQTRIRKHILPPAEEARASKRTRSPPFGTLLDNVPTTGEETVRDGGGIIDVPVQGPPLLLPPPLPSVLFQEQARPGSSTFAIPSLSNYDPATFNQQQCPPLTKVADRSSPHDHALMHLPISACLEPPQVPQSYDPYGHLYATRPHDVNFVSYHGIHQTEQPRQHAFWHQSTTPSASNHVYPQVALPSPSPSLPPLGPVGSVLLPSPTTPSFIADESTSAHGTPFTWHLHADENKPYTPTRHAFPPVPPDGMPPSRLPALLLPTREPPTLLLDHIDTPHGPVTAPECTENNNNHPKLVSATELEIVPWGEAEPPKTRQRRRLNDMEREQVNATRRIGACIRCSRLRERCAPNKASPLDPTAPCQTCMDYDKDSKKTIHRQGCWRGRLSAKVSFRRGGLGITKRFGDTESPAIDFIPDSKRPPVLDPDFFRVRSCYATSDQGDGGRIPPMQLHVRAFIPIEGDKLHSRWVQTRSDGVLVAHHVPTAPFAIADVASMNAYLLKYSEDNTLAGLRAAADMTSFPLVKSTFMKILDLCQAGPASSSRNNNENNNSNSNNKKKGTKNDIDTLGLLRQGVTYWFMGHQSMGSWWLCDRHGKTDDNPDFEKLDMEPVSDSNCPLRGKISLPRMVIAQMDNIRWQCSRTLDRRLHRGLEKAMARANYKAWMSVYLITFLLLHQAAQLSADRLRWARQNAMDNDTHAPPETRYGDKSAPDTKFVEDFQSSALVHLIHWRYYKHLAFSDLLGTDGPNEMRRGSSSSGSDEACSDDNKNSNKDKDKDKDNKESVTTDGGGVDDKNRATGAPAPKQNANAKRQRKPQGGPAAPDFTSPAVLRALSAQDLAFLRQSARQLQHARDDPGGGIPTRPEDGCWEHELFWVAAMWEPSRAWKAPVTFSASARPDLARETFGTLVCDRPACAACAARELGGGAAAGATC